MSTATFDAVAYKTTTREPSQFETAAGFEAPCELIVAGGTPS